MSKTKKPTEQLKPAEIKVTSISSEMKSAYLDYAMSVIVSRALPDIRDGLKPVQRRIIYAMHEGGNRPNTKYVKCAAAVGDTMKKYHPHAGGLYEALVRMGQPFSLRYTLVDGQGNFGSIDGDPPAAMRYTECRLDKLSDAMLEGIDKDTVNFLRNYSGDYYEPAVLPTKLPVLLLNGSIGIAVGMATSMAPHNLVEVVDGTLLAIEKGKPVETKAPHYNKDLFRPKEESFITEDLSPKKWYKFTSDVTIEELIEVIKGPDFPTGGTIYDQKETIRAYTTGKGKIITRGKVKIVEGKNGKFSILITEIPYLVNKSTLIAKIADLVKNKKIDGISTLRDESDKDGLRIFIGLKKDTRPQRILKQLYKLTSLQTSFHINAVGLIKNEPKVLTLKTILEKFVSHRQEVITRKTIYLLRKAKEREHILQGLKIALDHLDNVIETIKKSKDTPTAHTNLIKKFGLSAIQATGILEMPLKRLSALERQKIEDELTEKLKLITGYLETLENPQKVLGIIKTELQKAKEKYGDGRKTKVIKGGVGEISDEELVKQENVLVTITESGYIKRMPLSTYKTQGRGGKGVIGAQLREGDEVSELRVVNTHDEMLFFSSRGKVYSLRAWDIPEASRRAKGTAVVNLIDITSTDKITAIIPVPADTRTADNSYLTLTTRKGIIKRVAVSEFKNIRKTGIVAVKLSGEDTLGWVKLTGGKSEIIMTTASGKSIRFKEKDVRPMRRSAGGVRGIKLEEEDSVVGMDIVTPTEKNKLLVVTENGYGKQTKLSGYRVQNRGGGGVLTLRVNAKTGSLVDARVVDANVKDVILTSKEGQVIRMPVNKISTLGRVTQGVRIMRLSKDDKLTSVACIGK